MTRQPVQSSSIASVGHDAGVLQVEFRDGRVYEFAGVPRTEYEALLAAPSIGKHFHLAIRGKYTHMRVEADPVKSDV